MSTKQCPYCAEEIQAEAVVCKHCGRDVASGKVKKKRPWLGLLGMAMLGIGVVSMFCNVSSFTIGLTVVGTLILVYALLTGNVKFMGNG